MNGHDFNLAGARLTARASGALWWAEEGLLCVSDLHLGKSERMARRGGPILPPYEGRETLSRLETEIRALNPRLVICLGDSFDDLDAMRGLDAEIRGWLMTLMAGREWVWIEGNHDAGPVDLGGMHRDELQLGPLQFRHIAKSACAQGEISGHYHPKARVSGRGRSLSRRCYLLDATRLIMPAFGTYTGGLHSHDEVLSSLMAPGALAILLGDVPRAIAMPR